MANPATKPQSTEGTNPVVQVCGGGGSFVYDPLALSVPLSWYRGSSITEGDNVSISSWLNEGNKLNGQNLMTGLDTRPTCALGAAPNGDKAVDFDGTNQMLRSDDDVAGTTVFPLHIFKVFKQRVWATAEKILGGGIDGSSLNVRQGGISPGIQVDFTGENAGAPIDTWAIMELRVDALSGGTAAYDLHLGNTSTTGTITGNEPKGISLATDAWNAPDRADMQVAELMVWHGNLTGTELSTTRDYLSAKYFPAGKV